MDLKTASLFLFSFPFALLAQENPGVFNDNTANGFIPIEQNTRLVTVDPIPRFCSLIARFLDETPGQETQALWSAIVNTNTPGGQEETLGHIGVRNFVCTSTGVSFVWETSYLKEHTEELFVFGVVQDTLGNQILKLSRSPFQHKPNPFSWARLFAKTPLKTIDFTDTGFTEIGEKPGSFLNRTLCRRAQVLRSNTTAAVKNCTAHEPMAEWSSLQEEANTPSFSVISSQKIVFTYEEGGYSEEVRLQSTLKAKKIQGAGVVHKTSGP